MTRAMWYIALAVGAIVFTACPPPAPSPTAMAHPPGSCIGATAVDSQVANIRDSLSSKPELIRSAMPIYPPAMRSDRIEGEAKISFIIGFDGLPELTSLKVVSATNDEFARSAVTAMAAAAFLPACRNGRPVRIHVVMPVHFRISS